MSTLVRGGWSESTTGDIMKLAEFGRTDDGTTRFTVAQTGTHKDLKVVFLSKGERHSQPRNHWRSRDQGEEVHEGHLGHARSLMPIVKMPPFLVGRKERTGSWADAGEAAGTDSQLRRDMEHLKSEQENVEQELR